MADPGMPQPKKLDVDAITEEFSAAATRASEQPQKAHGEAAPAPKADDTNAPATGEMLTLKRNGKEIQVHVEKAIAFAQKGLDYEKKMEGLNQERAGLTEDRRRYEDYKQLRAKLEANPKLAEAMAYALAQPDRVRDFALGNVPTTPAADDSGGHPADDLTARERQQTARLEALQQEVSRLRQSEQDRDLAKRKQTVLDQVDQEIASYAHLKGKRGELARNQAIAYLSANPNDINSVPSVVAGIASDVMEALSAEQAVELDTQLAREGLATEPPTGTPTVTPPHEYKKEDLMNGNVLKGVMEEARRAGLPV